jgi:protein TonB
MTNHIAGFFISALVHIAALAIVINLANNPHPVMPKPKPVQLTLAMFKEKAPVTPVKKAISKTLPKNRETAKPTVLKPLQPPKVLPKRIKPIIKKQLPKLPPKPFIKKVILKKTVKPKRIKVHKKTIQKAIKKRVRKIMRKPVKRVAIRKQRKVVVKQPRRRVVKQTAKHLTGQAVRHVSKRTVRKASQTHTTHKIVHRAPIKRVLQQVSYKPVKSPRATTKKAPIRKPLSRPASNNAQAGRIKAAYKNRLRQLIVANRRYPKRAKRRGKQGTVLVSFVIFPNGVINNIKIARSSGDPTLDKAALKTVGKISGKLPYPKGINKSQWLLSVPVVYRLH